MYDVELQKLFCAKRFQFIYGALHKSTGSQSCRRFFCSFLTKICRAWSGKGHRKTIMIGSWLTFHREKNQSVERHGEQIVESV